MASQSTGETRLHTGWLALAWTGWGIVVLLSVISFVSSIPVYLAEVQRLCQGATCGYEQPTVEMARTLHQFGLSVGAYAATSVGLNGLIALLYCVVSIVILWRRPGDWLVLLITAMLISQALFEASYLPTPFNDPASEWYLPGLTLSFLSPTLFVCFCALFPNGRFVPRWMKWFLVGWVLVSLFGFFPTLPFADLIDTVSTISGFPIILGARVYRYRRISTPVERQQTKWVVYCVSILLLAFIAWYIPQAIDPALSQTGSLYDVMTRPLLTLFYVFPAIGVSVAILRYRLWDIDVLINKTLVYGSLTVLLGALYAGLIIGLESLAALLTGQTSDPVALVVSTLAIAALFQPVRRRIQAIIDRRFYRQKYDAEKTLAAFSAALRNEVDLNDLRGHLLAVVQETMQPAQVSLWLRSPQREQAKAPLTAPVPTSR